MGPGDYVSDGIGPGVGATGGGDGQETSAQAQQRAQERPPQPRRAPKPGTGKVATAIVTLAGLPDDVGEPVGRSVQVPWGRGWSSESAGWAAAGGAVAIPEDTPPSRPGADVGYGMNSPADPGPGPLLRHEQPGYDTDDVDVDDWLDEDGEVSVVEMWRVVNGEGWVELEHEHEWQRVRENEKRAGVVFMVEVCAGGYEDYGRCFARRLTKLPRRS